MKKILTSIIAAALIAVAAMAITSCSQWQTPFGDLDDAGKTVSVKFLANGGLFANTGGVTIVDAYEESAATSGSGIKIIAPDDTERGNRAFSITKNGHVFAGWYVAELDEDGTPVVDESGNVSFDKTQKWDFESDRLKLEAGGNYTSEVPSLTLCAAWIPYTAFNIYTPDGSGNFELYSTVSVQKLNHPVWTDKGSLDMKNYPKLDGMTFLAKNAYSGDVGRSANGRAVSAQRRTGQKAKVQHGGIYIQRSCQAGNDRNHGCYIGNVVNECGNQHGCPNNDGVKEE